MIVAIGRVPFREMSRSKNNRMGYAAALNSK